MSVMKIKPIGRGPIPRANTNVKEIRYRPKQYNLDALVINIERSKQYFPSIGR